MAHDWRIFRGEPNPTGAEDRLHRLPVAPPWRNFTTLDDWRSGTYRPGEREIEAINAALYLRRPLLVTGPPGVGKSSLIYAVAAELGLGAAVVHQFPLHAGGGSLPV